MFQLFKTFIWLQTSLISCNADAILILEYSFYLSEQNDPQPLFSAAQKYVASNTPARVGKALEDVSKQYNKASDDEKVEMILSVINQHHMG